MIVRELLTLLGYKTDEASKKKAEAGFSDVKKQALAVSAAVVAIGAAATAVFTRLVGDVAAAGDEVAKTSKQLGLNAQRMQELRFAANLAGTSNSEMTIGLRRLQASAKEAGDGTKSFVDDFARLGVQVKDSNGNLKSAEDLLFEVADGMNALENDTERVALAQTLLGRSGTKMIPLLTLGSKGIREQTMRARELGEVFDEELLANSEALVDAQRELEGAFNGIKLTIAREFMPIAIRFLGWLTDTVVMIRGPVGRGLQLLQTIFRGLARGVGFLVDLAEQLTDAITGVEGSLKIMAAVAVVAWGVATAPMLFALALLGLIGVAIVAVIEDLEAMGDGGESVIGGLIGEFQLLLKETDSVFDAITGVITTAVDFWADKLFGFTTDTKAELQGLLDFASTEFGRLGLSILEAGQIPGELGAQALPTVAGGAAGAISVINQIETSVQAATGMSPDELADETATRVVGGIDRLMRRTAAQLGVGGE
jgi:hypothetical protein